MVARRREPRVLRRFAHAPLSGPDRPSHTAPRASHACLLPRASDTARSAGPGAPAVVSRSMDTTPVDQPTAAEPPRGRYERGTLEFDRIVMFSGRGLRHCAHVAGRDHRGAQNRRLDQPAGPVRRSRRHAAPGIAFFTSFVVIASFWVAHHRFVARLTAIHRRLLWANLVYLAFVAFLPFPAAVMGDFDGNAVAVISTPSRWPSWGRALEAVMFRMAWRGKLLRRRLTLPMVRYAHNGGTDPGSLLSDLDTNGTRQTVARHRRVVPRVPPRSRPGPVQAPRHRRSIRLLGES